MEKIQILDALLDGSKNSRKFIYVLTPKGDVKRLQAGSTPVDFAYHIHSDIGNHCFQCHINGKPFPLNTQLRNGDTVNIITRKNARPSIEWLAPKDTFKNSYPFVTTKTAHNKIIQWHRILHREDNILSGKELLFQEINKDERKFGKDKFQVLLKSESLKDVAAKFNYQSVPDLLAAIGYGPSRINLVVGKSSSEQNLKNKKYVAVTPSQVINQLIQNGKSKIDVILKKKKVRSWLSSSDSEKDIQRIGYNSTNDFFIDINVDDSLPIVLVELLLGDTCKMNDDTSNEEKPFVHKGEEKPLSIIRNRGEAILIKDFPIHLAQCCSPEIYDESVGFLKKNSYKIFPKTGGRGVVIHRPECFNIRASSNDKPRPIVWHLSITISVIDREAIMHEITGKFTSININEVHSVKSSQNKSRITLEFEIDNKEKLRLVKDSLESINLIQGIDHTCIEDRTRFELS